MPLGSKPAGQDALDDVGKVAMSLTAACDSPICESDGIVMVLRMCREHGLSIAFGHVTRGGSPWGHTFLIDRAAMNRCA